MAKELPYFKFEPAEYLTRDISFCSLSAQGLFINICSYYWQRGCELTKEQLLRRLNHEKELNELISEGVVDLKENVISIKFLDKQLNEVENKSKTNSANGSKGGRPKKNPIETETKPKQNPIESESISESKGIREDKIKEDNINKVFLSEIEISDDENFLIYNNEKFERTKSEIKYFEIANVFRKTFIENLKKKGAPFKIQEKATFKNYVDPIRLMLENKECTIDDLRDVETYLSGVHSEFWKKNILSTVKLRKQIQQLIMEARKPIVKPKPQERL